MRHILRIILPLIAIIAFVNLYYEHSDELNAVSGYPVWLKDKSGKQTSQTSGLSFVGEKDGRKIFISCDDIGKVNRIEIDESKNPPEVFIFEASYSSELTGLFGKFKRKDMEEIFYDKTLNKIYLSIEGHEYSSYDPEVYRNKEGIYELTFNKDILSFDSLLTIKRLKFPQEIYSNTTDNTGFEGFSATEKYFFLGLENIQSKGNNFSDSSYIYIINKETNELKTIETRKLNISSVCGLYAEDDFNLYGIDRNRRSMFYINFNQDFSINKFTSRTINLSIPNHNDINRILGIAPESVTFDNSGDIYVAVDPWKDFYKPDLADQKKLSDEELQNFGKLVPILYKFRNQFR